MVFERPKGAQTDAKCWPILKCKMLEGFDKIRLTPDFDEYFSVSVIVKDVTDDFGRYKSSLDRRRCRLVANRPRLAPRFVLLGGA